jgi:N-acetylmuramoyl-L-alanine amidase
MRKAFIDLCLTNLIVIVAIQFVCGKSVYQKDEKHVSVVVLDPGHGGKDFGANIGDAREKDIVLDLAKRLGETIKANFPEIKVIFTRTTDVFIPLYDRAKIANKNKADLFISIHVNGTENKTVHGTETFVLGQHRSKENLEVAKKENSVILLEDDYSTTYEGFDPNSPESYIMFELVQDEYLDQSVMLASEIQHQFSHYAKRMDRSVKQAGFLVLRQAAMPSVLVEVGFISHPDERNYMLSESGKSTLSASIFNAFKAYKKKIEEKSSFVVHAETGDSQRTINESKTVSGESASAATIENKTIKKNEENTGSIYFSVQIAASNKKIEPTPSNFKGEKNVFRKETNEISRFYSGKFGKYEDALKEKKRIEKKYPESFVVAFENDEIISVKKAREKM